MKYLFNCFVWFLWFLASLLSYPLPCLSIGKPVIFNLTFKVLSYNYFSQSKF